MKKFFSLIFSLLAIASLSAQVTTSSVNGRVLDDQKAPLAGATVVAVHTPSGTQYASIANNEGRFVINGMRAGGPYSIEVSYLGMSTLEYKDVYLKLGEPFEIEAVMNSTTAIDAVVVVAERTFNASKTGAAQNFSLQTVESMPTIDRSVYDIVKLTPQATVNKNGGISFAGSNNRYNSFQVDGAVANDSFGLAASGTNGGQTGANPISIDAIEEVQVSIAPFNVRQSGFTGGAINAITKSGTNTIKGTFYSYVFNEDMIGTTPGDVTTRTKYDKELAQTYGVTVGGPIIKNKLFLFASAEYYDKSYPNVYSPSNGTYDSTELIGEVINEGSSLGSYFTKEVADAMIAHYNSTYGVESGESYSPHQVEDRSINALVRLDWNINRNNRFMFRYQLMDAYSDKYGSGKYTYYFNNSSYKMSDRTNTFVAELNSRINDEMSNELRATAVLVRDKRTIPYQGATMYIKDNVTINMGTEYSSGANSMNSDTFTISDNFSIFKGNHNITIGTHNEFYKFNNLFIQYAFGEYTFNSIADFFADKFSQYDYKYSDPNMTNGDTRWAATTYAAELGIYAQDEWKPSRNFTLTYGIRGDVPMLLNKPTENATFNATDFATNNGEYVGTVPNKTILWSPRVGFRYFTDDSHKTLIRGGAGLFTGRVPFVWLSNAYNNTGMETKSVTIKDKTVLGTLPTTSDPYNDLLLTDKISGSGSGATINTLNKDFKYPQVFRVNVGMDHEFDNGWRFTFDALYSKTMNNVYFKNLAIEKKGVVYGVNAAAAESNPNSVAPHYDITSSDYYAIVALGNTNKGYTYSLSGQIQKSFDFGLDLMASYTYGHAYSVNDGTSSVAYSNWKYNYSYDTNVPELSYSLFDRPHKLMAVVSYKTPVYAKRFQTTVSLTYEATSGQRFSYTMNETEDFNGDGQKGNSVLYIPTQEEIGMMNWAVASDAVLFEQYIRSDKYLNSHRGQWSERYAGMAKFEHHFDLHLAQDIFYDKANGRKIQITADLLNLSNLLNRNWGLYYGSAYNLQILNVTKVTDDDKGNYTPTYKYTPKTISISDFYSRWRCQVGLRLTF